MSSLISISLSLRSSRFGAVFSRRLVRSISAKSQNSPFDVEVEQNSKHFNFQTLEKSIYQWWEKKGLFKPDPAAKEPFVVPMPPPNVTGRLHVGHAMFLAIQDILVRFNRMNGKSTLWFPGTDHAGIATQMLIERDLLKKGITLDSIGREGFLKEAWRWKAEKTGEIQEQMRRMGASADWSREKFTLEPSMNHAVTEAFLRLYERGLIYRGQYLVNWSPALRTALSDLEVEHHQEKGTLFYFRYFLEDGTDFIPVATTRPETILGDCAVCVHPSDTRYAKFIGKMARVPILGRAIPIIADDYVDPTFGTGALKVTPAHDWNDFEIGKRHGLTPLNIFNKDGTINENGGKYAGMDRFICRKALWEDMAAGNLVIKTELHELNVPRSQRGGDVVEPVVSWQWFMKMDSVALQSIDAVKNNDLQIIPARFEKNWFHWMENIHDWCISRQLVWGHRIPVYYVTSDEGSPEVQTDFIVARDEAHAQEIATKRYGRPMRLTQDPDVLDTWFSSALWPFAALGWPSDTEDLKKFYPATLLETGYDILFFWVSRMVAMGINLTNKIPFKTVYLHGLVRDGEGQKMSKTKGNVVDPLDTIDVYGCDALRFTLVVGSTPGQDIPLSAEKVEASRNFVNKLWNIGKFYRRSLGHASAQDIDDKLLDDVSRMPFPEAYFIQQTNHLIREVSSNLQEYQIGEAGKALYQFIWDELADWLVEIVKFRLRSTSTDAICEQRRTLGILRYAWRTSLQLLHPFMPFVTEALWQSDFTGSSLSESIMTSTWPTTSISPDNALQSNDLYQQMVKMIREIRHVRAKYNIASSKGIEAIVFASDAIREQFQKEAGLIGGLANCKTIRFAGEAPPELSPESSVHLIISGDLEVYLPLASLVDAEKERSRIEKQLQKLSKELAGFDARLSNPSFLSGASEAVVSDTKTRASALREQLIALNRALTELNKP